MTLVCDQRVEGSEEGERGPAEHKAEADEDKLDVGEGGHGLLGGGLPETLGQEHTSHGAGEAVLEN